MVAIRISLYHQRHLTEFISLIEQLTRLMSTLNDITLKEASLWNVNGTGRYR